MRKFYKSFFIFLLLISLQGSVAQAGNEEREALRTAYSKISGYEIHTAYINRPAVQSPYSAGELSREALDQALASVNFLRTLAGLEPLELDMSLCDAAQCGAMLLAANQGLSHTPDRPQDMPESLYRTGAEATAACNLAMFNWQADDLLREAAFYFARDDGEGNRALLGHRRWLLYPGMGVTGFGLAEDVQGHSYATMYVLDSSRDAADYDMILWPSEGVFPAECMLSETPWSISPNPRLYDLNQSDPVIRMTEEVSGASFVFDGFQEDTSQDQYFALGGGRYGDGPAYIFRPDLARIDELMYGYQQNQLWTIRLEGLVRADGSPAEPMEYRVEMVSLTPQDPSAVEITQRALSLRVGENAVLEAQVIPDWADDLSVSWHSADESVATVDKNGMVRALSPGQTQIIAEAVNGRFDCAEVTVGN